MTEQERFDRCLGAVLRLEGGYTEDPRDPGGPTNMGVTLSTLSQALGRPATRADIQALTPQAVSPIYRALYWTRTQCGDLAAGLDLMVFDAAVNMGPSVAAELLQTALGVGADGAVGPHTLAIARKADPAPLVRAMSRLRAERYRRLAHFDVFGMGWLRRVQTVEALALDWIASSNSLPVGVAT